MFFYKVILLIILSLNKIGLNQNVPERWYKSPATFYYQSGLTIYMQISLRDLPQEAESYKLYYQTGICNANTRKGENRCDGEFFYSQVLQHGYALENKVGPSWIMSAFCKIFRWHCPKVREKEPPIKYGPIPTTGHIEVHQQLNEPCARFYIELKQKNNIVCSTQIVANGVNEIYPCTGEKTAAQESETASNTTFVPEKSFDIDIQNINGNPLFYCYLHVYFEGKCQGPQPADNRCSKTSDNFLICESPDEEMPINTNHQWFHVDDKNNYLGKIPKVTGKSTKLVFYLEKFDNNTFVHSTMTSTNWMTYLPTVKHKITIPANEFREYKVDEILRYTDGMILENRCRDNKNSQIGRIDPSGSVLQVFNDTNNGWRLISSDNGSTVCCIRFDIHETSKETTVQRIIDKMLLLIYIPSGGLDVVYPAKPSNKLHEETEKLINSEKAIQSDQTSLTTEKEKNPGTFHDEKFNIKKDIENKKNQLYSNQGGSIFYDKIYYFVLAALLGILLIIVVIFLTKKLFQKNSGDNAVQLETYASTNACLYSELDIQSGNNRLLRTTEETPYAQIIGVLAPKENVK